MPTIAHITTSVATGGAQAMLYKLLQSISAATLQSVVISLMGRHSRFGDYLDALGVPIYSLDLRQGEISAAALWRLSRLIRQLKPDVIQGWMYHGNLAGYLARLLSRRRVPLFWNIRHSLASIGNETSKTANVIRAGAWLSQRADVIIYNARTSAAQHHAAGYAAARTVVIPNGFDCNVFRPSDDARDRLRAACGLDSSTPLIGLVARFHPMKDHAGFCAAAAQLKTQYPAVRYILAGPDIDAENDALMAMIRAAGLGECMFALGDRHDIADVIAGLDVATSCSAYGEAFSNAIGEAMACAVPCVVTDVGDSAWIVGDTGIVVPPRDAAALTRAWRTMLDEGAEGRRRRGAASRERIRLHFSIRHIAQQYIDLYSAR